MLTSLEIRSKASFCDTGVRIDDLGTCNVIFGPNGSGKSTIGRVLADLTAYPSCAAGWASTPAEVIVFGGDYVARNCHPSQAMPGIYTLGGDAEAVREVERKEGDRDQSRARSRAARDRLEGAEGQRALDSEDAKFSRSIWNKRKETWEAHKPLTFGPTWSAEARFASDYRARAEQWTGDEPPSLADLLAQAQTFAGSPPVAAERLPPPPRPSAEDAVRERLRKPLVPASDQPIAELVAELGCADWVKEGLPLLRRSSGRCPFCQQPVDHALASRIADIFDATYESGIDAIRKARATYADEVEAITKWVGTVSGSPHLDADAGGAFAAWSSLHRRNLDAFDRKLSAPSSQVELDADGEAFARVQASIDAANAKADHQTNLSENFARERSAWQEAVWTASSPTRAPTTQATKGAGGRF